MLCEVFQLSSENRQIVKKGVSIAREVCVKASCKFRQLVLSQADLSSEERYKDVKSEVDQILDEFISSELVNRSDFSLISEERGFVEARQSEWCWVVDPLDGTVNFVRGIECYAISLGLLFRGAPVGGVVCDLSSGKTYWGGSGIGAWCDGAKICVSSVAKEENAICATGFPSGRSYDQLSLESFVEKVQRYKKIRAIGSASLMLIGVAKGVFDCYQEEDIFEWDVAAGLAILHAAGGEFSLRKGSGDYKVSVYADNSHLRRS